MLPKKIINTFGVASCLGGSESTCHTAPDEIKNSQFQKILSAYSVSLNWQEIIGQKLWANNKLEELGSINHKIAIFTEEKITQSEVFLVTYITYMTTVYSLVFYLLFNLLFLSIENR